MSGKVFAVLSGGGVKGAALVGCLARAEELGFRFDGYAGTSAGAMVAALAAAGYAPLELHRLMVEELDFFDLLDSKGVRLRRAQSAIDSVSSESSWLSPGKWNSASVLIWYYFRYRKGLGIDSGEPLREWIAEKLKAKLGTHDPTFDDLPAKIDLKIVASDVARRLPVVHDRNTRGGEPISEAVRASASYPFAFRPFRVEYRNHVDGGLCSNLPVFTFAGDDAEDASVVAFDLVGRERRPSRRDGLKHLLGDMLATTLEAPDRIFRAHAPQVVYIPISTPEGIDTLNFWLSPEQRKQLYDAGKTDSEDPLKGFKEYQTSRKRVGERVRALKPGIMKQILTEVAAFVEEASAATDIRVAVAVPQSADERLSIIYQYGMDEDDDRHLRLKVTAGCSGGAFSNKEPTLADLEEVQTEFESWGLSAIEQEMVRDDRSSMISVPIFRPVIGYGANEDVTRESPIGVLSADSSVKLQATGWDQAEFLKSLVDWSEVVARVLYGKYAGVQYG